MFAALLGTKFGQWLFVGAVIALAVAIFVVKVFNAGRSSALTDGMEAQLRNVKARQDEENRVRTARDAERKRMRDAWTRS